MLSISFVLKEQSSCNGDSMASKLKIFFPWPFTEKVSDLCFIVSSQICLEGWGGLE